MMAYPYVVAAHLSAVVFLVGGLLAQERLLRAASRCDPSQQRPLLIALQALDRQVTTPALALTWIFGLWLAFRAGWLGAHWLTLKLVFVVALSALHGMQSGRLRRFARQGGMTPSPRDASVGVIVAMIAIAMLAVVKPF